jgi:hypothetical protein
MPSLDQMRHSKGAFPSKDLAHLPTYRFLNPFLFLRTYGNWVVEKGFHMIRKIKDESMWVCEFAEIYKVIHCGGFMILITLSHHI